MNEGTERSSSRQRRRRRQATDSAQSRFKKEHDAKLIRLALHKSPFFTCLDEEQIERLIEAAECKVFEPGEIVILEGCVDQEDDYEDQEGEGQDGGFFHEGRRLISRLTIPEGPADAEEAMMGAIDVTPRRHEPLEKGLPRPEEQENTITQAKTIASGQEAGIPDDAEGRTDQSSETSKSEYSDSDNEKETPEPEEDSSSSEKASVLDASKPPAPPKSNVKRSIYIVKNGKADVWFGPEFNPASFGPGTLFGEGGFLFGRQHSASVVANRHEPLECWVVDFATFRRKVLPSQNMSKLFHKYASNQDYNGTYYMTMDEFVQAIEQEEMGRHPTLQDPLVSLRISNTYDILSKQNSPSKRIYLSDFCFFHLIMARPDPEVDVAFLLMDQRQTGRIELTDLAKFINPLYPYLDLRSQFFQRYFGKDGKQSIRQQDFSQFLIDLQREMGKQAFLRAVDEKGTGGYLAPSDFVRVLKTSCGWRLPQGVAERLESVYCHGPVQAGEAAVRVSVQAGKLKGASVEEVARDTEASVLADMEQREKNLGIRYFAYGDFIAFQEVLAALPGICNLIDRAQEIKGGPVSPDDFKVANRVLGLGGRLSRRQVDIIFTLFDLDRDGFISHEDTVSVCGVDFAQRLVAVKGRGDGLTFAPPPKFIKKPETDQVVNESVEQSGKQLPYFGLSVFAGALGVVALYPLELIKTRLMNQRITKEGGRLYANSFECMAITVRAGGFAGLYRGLTPQLLGVVPEKAIKLQVNDLLRLAFSSNDDATGQQQINLSLEVLAGACAGACQLLATNPMEIAKTRLILQDETAELLKKRGFTPPQSKSFSDVVKELGFPGVYRGASACLARDVPFSAIYFPAYAALKDFLSKRHHDSPDTTGKASLNDLLVAGTTAAVPAALVTTPFDVMRVRIQAIPRPGEPTYDGIRDCATKIYEAEGVNGFFRGSMARILRIAPQFGISLVAYEQMTEWFGMNNSSTITHRPATNAPIDPRDYRTAFPAASLTPKTKEIDSMMRNFGVVQDHETGDQSPSSRGAR